MEGFIEQYNEVSSELGFPFRYNEDGSEDLKLIGVIMEDGPQYSFVNIKFNEDGAFKQLIVEVTTAILQNFEEWQQEDTIEIISTNIEIIIALISPHLDEEVKYEFKTCKGRLITLGLRVANKDYPYMLFYSG